MENDSFADWRQSSIRELGADQRLADLSQQWFDAANALKYSYHFEWLGRPIIQYPTDIVAMQEIIWRTKPDLIVETGVAHGGSAIFSASMLALLDLMEPSARAPQQARRVVAVDIDIRPESGALTYDHPLASRIDFIEGSSTEQSVINRVYDIAQDFDRVMVILDSDHTHDHVLAELEAYSPLVSGGCYLVVMDTVVANLPSDSFPDRPWGPGNNPMTAVKVWLENNSDFVVDVEITDKLRVSVAPSGYLRRMTSP